MFKTARFDDRAFKPLSIAVIAVSDTRTLETDTGGALLKSLLEADGHSCAERVVVRDDIQLIR
jgi:molybdenum cofactor biosynthesis protein B